MDLKIWAVWSTCQSSEDGRVGIVIQPCKVYHCNSSHVWWERSRMGAWSAYHVIVIHRIHLPRIKLYCTATPRTRVRSRLVHPLIDRRPAADENCTYCTKLHSTVNTPIAILTYCTYSHCHILRTTNCKFRFFCKNAEVALQRLLHLAEITPNF